MTAAEWVEGRLQRVLWASDASGYAVARFEGPEGPFVAVGALADLLEQAEGVFVALEGRWEDHAVHGRQFRCAGALHGSPRTLDGMRLYLASSAVPGIGPSLAGRLVDHFGLSTPVVLAEHPERLTEVSGIGPAKAKAIQAAWARDEEGRALAMTLRGLGVNRRLVQKIRDRYGERAGFVVREAPYRLVEEVRGIGFRTADAMARAAGLAEDAPERVRAAVVAVLDQYGQDGHCWLGEEELARRVSALGVPISGLPDAIGAAEAAGRLVREGAALWPGGLYEAECTVARELTALLQRAGAAPEPARVLDAERWAGVELDPQQRAAVRAAVRGGVTVITGGPGTGQTTLLRVLLRAADEQGLRWALASPTGRAARRLEEATVRGASTLHRLLEVNPADGRFSRGPGHPLDVDGVVVDEASMVDIELMAALVLALPSDRPVSLVCVGDADQLPSVGPGQVLRDLVDAEVVPVARLRRVHRQQRGSGIVVAADAVHGGGVPRSGERAGFDDCYLIAREDPAAIEATVVHVVAERLRRRGFDPFSDVQVLAPTRRGPLGTERLNERLQAHLNPDGQELKRGERVFRVGDRVLCVRNRSDVEVFNGDVGRVRAIAREGLTVEVDGRSIAWERDELPLLDLAYATTVHKAPGSEYPAVVVVLHGSHGVMLRRNLFYTALTRARQFVVVVGDPAAWERAARNAGERRNTALADRLRRGDVEVVWPDDALLGDPWGQ